MGRGADGGHSRKRTADRFTKVGGEDIRRIPLPPRSEERPLQVTIWGAAGREAPLRRRCECGRRESPSSLQPSEAVAVLAGFCDGWVAGRREPRRDGGWHATCPFSCSAMRAPEGEKQYEKADKNVSVGLRACRADGRSVVRHSGRAGRFDGAASGAFGVHRRARRQPRGRGDRRRHSRSRPRRE